jgi:uncharacterized membrane protein YfhO
MEIAQIELLCWVIIGGFGVFLCVIELGFSERAAFISAVAFMSSGQMIVLPNWGCSVYNAVFFPYLLLGYFRAKKYRIPFSPLSILSIGMMIFGGYVPFVVVGIYLLIGYVILDSFSRKEILFGIKFLAVTFILSVLITLPKLLPLYNATSVTPRLHAVSADPRFGIISLYNFMTFFLPVKYYFSLYIGGMAVILLIYSILKKKFRFNALFVMFVLSAWLLLVGKDGSFSLLRQLTNVTLPFMELVRLDFLYWSYPLIFAILYISRYIDDFLDEENLNAKVLTILIFVAMLSFLFFREYNVPIYYKAYLVHLSISLLWFGITFLNRRKAVQTFMIIVLLTAEFFMVLHRVDINEPPIKDGEYIEMTLTDQNYIDQSFQNSELVTNRMRIRFIRDNLRPGISDSRKWPYLVSRTPGFPYPNFIEAMNNKRFVGWWYNTQERFEFIKIKDSPLLAQMDGWPLFIYLSRFTGSPVDNAVSFDKISCSNFTFTVRSAEPGFLLLHQMYDDRWRVLIDKKEQPLLNANNFFMGVDVEPGDHSIRFVFRDRNFTIALTVSLLTLAVMVAIVVFKRYRKKTGESVNG